ncbi:hypothetical protein [Flavobacterium oreochromis]|uniref:hypothetical protein n=1 Tax=Flavobacterium oreochromis TaxID=2906078 RepID=UPI00385FE316
MKKVLNIKVNNPSAYWFDFEGELSIYYHIKWCGKIAVNKLISNELLFFQKYVTLCNKYGFAIPLNCDESNLVELYKQEKNKNEVHGISAWYFMFYMYKYGEALVYPSKLFTEVTDKSFKNIVNIDPIFELQNLEDKNISFAPPVRIELREKLEEIVLTCYLDNDAFNSWIDNKKTKRDPNIGGKGCWVDNSDLAYLNTPRLNSFLRDLKKLCFECGASEFEFENLGLNDFCEDGVMFDGKVVYYEDIVDLLEPYQRIVSE